MESLYKRGTSVFTQGVWPSDEDVLKVRDAKLDFELFVYDEDEQQRKNVIAEIHSVEPMFIGPGGTLFFPPAPDPFDRQDRPKFMLRWTVTDCMAKPPKFTWDRPFDYSSEMYMRSMNVPFSSWMTFSTEMYPFNWGRHEQANQFGPWLCFREDDRERTGFELMWQSYNPDLEYLPGGVPNRCAFLRGEADNAVGLYGDNFRDTEYLRTGFDPVCNHRNPYFVTNSSQAYNRMLPLAPKPWYAGRVEKSASQEQQEEANRKRDIKIAGIVGNILLESAWEMAWGMALDPYTYAHMLFVDPFWTDRAAWRQPINFDDFDPQVETWYSNVGAPVPLFRDQRLYGRRADNLTLREGIPESPPNYRGDTKHMAVFGYSKHDEYSRIAKPTDWYETSDNTWECYATILLKRNREHAGPHVTYLTYTWNLDFPLMQSERELYSNDALDELIEFISDNRAQILTSPEALWDSQAYRDRVQQTLDHRTREAKSERELLRGRDLDLRSQYQLPLNPEMQNPNQVPFEIVPFGQANPRSDDGFWPLPHQMRPDVVSHRRYHANQGNGYGLPREDTQILFMGKDLTDELFHHRELADARQEALEVPIELGNNRREYRGLVPINADPKSGAERRTCVIWRFVPDGEDEEPVVIYDYVPQVLAGARHNLEYKGPFGIPIGHKRTFMFARATEFLHGGFPDKDFQSYRVCKVQTTGARFTSPRQFAGREGMLEVYVARVAPTEQAGMLRTAYVLHAGYCRVRFTGADSSELRAGVQTVDNIEETYKGLVYSVDGKVRVRVAGLPEEDSLKRAVVVYPRTSYLNHEIPEKPRESKGDWRDEWTDETVDVSDVLPITPWTLHQSWYTMNTQMFWREHYYKEPGSECGPHVNGERGLYCHVFNPNFATGVVEYPLDSHVDNWLVEGVRRDPHLVTAGERIDRPQDQAPGKSKVAKFRGVKFTETFRKEGQAASIVSNSVTYDHVGIVALRERPNTFLAFSNVGVDGDLEGDGWVEFEADAFEPHKMPIFEAETEQGRFIQVVCPHLVREGGALECEVAEWRWQHVPGSAFVERMLPVQEMFRIEPGDRFTVKLSSPTEANDQLEVTWLSEEGEDYTVFVEQRKERVEGSGDVISIDTGVDDPVYISSAEVYRGTGEFVFYLSAEQADAMTNREGRFSARLVRREQLSAPVESPVCAWRPHFRPATG